MAGLRAVLWDIDGTLLDSRLSIRETLNTVLKERGLPPFTKQEVEWLIGKPLRQILATKTSDPDAIEAMTQRYRSAYTDSGWVTARVFEGLEPLLLLLKGRGLRLGVVTSKGQFEVETLLVDLGLAGLFDAVVGDDDKRPLKPDPAPVFEACHRLQVLPAQAAMVGDTSFDMAAAKQAGAVAIGVLWGIQDEAALRAAGADLVVATVEELARLLRKA